MKNHHLFWSPDIKEFIPFVVPERFISFRTFASSLDLETIRNNILTNHNKYRKLHQVEDLTRNSEIEKIAQNYSEILAATKSFYHSSNKYQGEFLGENLYSSSGKTLTGTDASERWYSENLKYDFNKPGFSFDTVHFTQLVWKSSKKIGCGAACNGTCYVTCNYYPTGNVYGKYESNVFPIKKSSEQEQDSETGKKEESETSEDKSSKNNSFNEKKGMSTAGKVFLTIFILLFVAIIAFAIYHFAYRKRTFYELKIYFKCFS